MPAKPYSDSRWGNYAAPIIAKVISENKGMRAKDSIPLLLEAIDKLADDTDRDYWKATEGNARKALSDLLALARMAPEGIWQGD
jgi:hypothetical protein